MQAQKEEPVYFVFVEAKSVKELTLQMKQQEQFSLLECLSHQLPNLCIIEIFYFSDNW